MPGLTLTGGRFRAYPNHAEVECYNCGRIMRGEPRDDDYPPGRGQWSQECRHCGQRTWYDIHQAKEREWQ